MSRLIEGKPIAMYSDEELLALLDRIICTINIDPRFCAIAEASSRALRQRSSPPTGSAEEVKGTL